MEEKIKAEIEKKVLLRNIQRQVKMRKFFLPLLAIVLLFFNIFLPLNSSNILGSVLILFAFSLFFFGSAYIQKDSSLTASAIRQILVNIVFLELLAIWAGFYFFSAIANSWLIPIVYPASLIFIFYLILISPLFEDLYRTFFYLTTWLGLSFLVLLNHPSFVTSLSTHRFNADFVNSSSLVSIILAGLAVFGVRLIVNCMQDQASWWNSGLEKGSQKLQERLDEKDESIFKLRKELRETKEILQIRTLARARELKGLTEKFQKMIKEQGGVAKMDKKQRSKIQEMQATTKALLNILEDSEKTRKQLAKEKELTSTVINNFVDGLIILDPRGIIQEVNKEAQQVFKIKEKDVQDQPLTILKKYPLVAPAVPLILRGGRVQLIQKQDFSSIPESTIEVSTVALRSKKHRLGYLVVFHDVSREKHVQKMKTDFVSIVAHQLRTPLSAIKWSLKMILDKEMGKISAQQRAWLNKTYQSNERMIVLVNDLLNVSRIEEGRFLYKPQEVDLRDIIDKVIQNNDVSIKRKGLKISFRGKTQDIPKVKVDAEKMQLAIQNLITNAINYTPRGGKITVAISALENNVMVMVKDTGIGISKIDQKKIFQRFFRSRNAIKVRTNGTGLGLFITKNIIEAHHGKIWFKSQLGKGTAFYFTIPYRQS